MSQHKRAWAGVIAGTALAVPTAAFAATGSPPGPGSLADAEVLGALAPARLAVVTSGPARRFVLDLGAQARLCPADGKAVSGSLRLPAEALIRLVTGRLDRAHTPAGTVAEGRSSLEELRRLYPGS